MRVAAIIFGVPFASYRQKWLTCQTPIEGASARWTKAPENDPSAWWVPPLTWPYGDDARFSRANDNERAAA